MPPSGFSQKAIQGLLEFVRASYETTLTQYRSQQSALSESEFLKQSSAALEENVTRAVTQRPLDVDKRGMEGLVTFVTSCYRDLVHEIYNGQDTYGRKVEEGSAIQKELDQIGDYLKNFKI